MRFLQGLAIFLGVMVSMAFVTEGPRRGGTSPIDHLERSPRWALTSTSLVQSGERGLGGGLEYAIDDSICGLNFIDDSNCEIRKEIIAEAFAEWRSGHPALRFTDVSNAVIPAFPLAATRESGQGAEIDVFGATGEYFPPFLNPALTGYTIFYEGEPGALTLTNGSQLTSASAIQSADIRINAAKCFYIDTAQGRPNCVHFPSVILHEIGHALGLGHPDENLRYGLDTDRVAGNEIQIDCQAPSKGLVRSGNYNAASVMVGRDVQGPGRWRRGLSWGDVAARDALYPHCGIERVERFSPQWGAFAWSENQLEGWARFAPDPRQAENSAMAQCRAAGGMACAPVKSFDGCFAFAQASNGQTGFATANRSDEARINAVLACQETGNKCRVKVDFCAFE